MSSIRSRLFVFLLKHRKKRPAWNMQTSVEKFREECIKVSKILGRVPKNIKVEKVDINGIYAEWILPENANHNKVILYIIGGGYISGSCDDHRGIVSRIAKNVLVPILIFNHALAPENPYPAALNDTLTMYKWLLKTYSESNIIIMGESAGGGLSLAALLAIKENKLPQPKACIVLSPWTDLTLSGESYISNKSSCLSPKGMNVVCAKHYIGNNNPQNPLISPLFGDLSCLPPLLIIVGSSETLLDDSIMFANKAKISGVDVTLEIGHKMMHCYPLLPSFVPEAKLAMKKISTFVRKHFLLS